MASSTTRVYFLFIFLATLSHLSAGVVADNYYCRYNRLHEVRVRTGEYFVQNSTVNKFSNWTLFCERCRKSSLLGNHRERRVMTLNARRMTRNVSRRCYHVTSRQDLLGCLTRRGMHQICKLLTSLSDSLYLFLLLHLLSCGDIESNPGPPTLRNRPPKKVSNISQCTTTHTRILRTLFFLFERYHKKKCL
jgi:hypothetical protein